MGGTYNKVTPVSLGQSRGANRDPTGTSKIPNSHPSTPSTFQGSWEPFPGYNVNNFFNNMNFSGSAELLRPSFSGNLERHVSPNVLPPPPPPPKGPYPVAVPPPPMSSFNPLQPGIFENNKKRPRYGGISKDEAERRKRRAERFGNSNQKHKINTTGIDEEENFANLNAISTKSHKFDKNKRIVGRSQDLEKPYLRLTSEPNPDKIRPLPILKKAFHMLMKKYEKKQASYQYLCDQFKSMRQDLRVQIIENQFTIQVYQSHARIALENGDIGEFNQCQSRLITLFDLPNIKRSCLEEFTCYKILYCILTGDHGAIMSLRLKLMTKEVSVFEHPSIQEAFQLARSQLVGDYHSFMKIHSSMKGLGKKLVDLFIDQEKLRSLMTISRSYNQIPLDFLQKEFQFQNVESIIGFLSRRGLSQFIVVKNQGEHNEYRYLDTRACRPYILR